MKYIIQYSTEKYRLVINLIEAENEEELREKVKNTKDSPKEYTIRKIKS